MISAEKISKRYGNLFAVRDASFFVPKGQVLGLLGQNGAGKTTLMNILTGCLAPSGGNVLIDGHDIITQPRLAKHLIGYLPEVAPLYDEMTVWAYLRFVCELKDVVSEQIDSHLAEICEKAGISDIKGRVIGHLSKGYRQRVGLAQALCGSPEIIILDEPTAGLDPVQTTEFRTLIRQLKGEHTIILSSHILSEVENICERVLILHRGNLVSDTMMHSMRGNKVRLRASIAGGENTILPALHRLEHIEDVQVVRGSVPGVCDVILQAPHDAQIERELFTLLSAMHAPLLRLYPVSQSLEDIFLRSIAEQS